MIRPEVRGLLRSRTPAIYYRSFVTTRALAAEGDTGAPRAGGVAASDSFNRREQVMENMFIKQKETEQFKKLREKLAEQRKHLDEVESHINEMEKASNEAQR